MTQRQKAPVKSFDYVKDVAFAVWFAGVWGLGFTRSIVRVGLCAEDMSYRDSCLYWKVSVYISWRYTAEVFGVAWKFFVEIVVVVLAGVLAFACADANDIIAGEAGYSFECLRILRLWAVWGS